MSRPLRIDFPGALWHVTSRGNEKKEIFRDDDDRLTFLEFLGTVVHRYNWQLHSFVLMSNHYHFISESSEPNLSLGMRDLNGCYAQKFNRKHERVGHLFQRRFHSVLVEQQTHLLELIRYVVLNPVRAGLTNDPADWRWSSYHATAGLCDPPSWLNVKWTLDQFSLDHEKARGMFCEFVAAGIGQPVSPWLELKGGIFLGGEGFRARIAAKVDAIPRSREYPRSHRQPIRPTLVAVATELERVTGVSRTKLMHRGASDARTAFAFVAREVAGVATREIAEFLRLSASRVSGLISCARSNPAIAEVIEKLVVRLRTQT